MCFLVEEALEDAGAEEYAFAFGEGDGFLVEFYFPGEGVEQTPLNQFHVVVSVDEYVFEPYFSVEDGDLVQVFDCVDEADEYFPD